MPERFMRRRRGSSTASVDVNEVFVPHDQTVLRTMLRISHAVLTANYFDELLEVVAEQALIALRASSLSISRWERETDILRTLINVGELLPGEERWPESETYPVAADEFLAQLLRQGRPYAHAVDNPDTAPAALEYLNAIGKESEIAVPIMFNDEMWGELWATGTEGRRFGLDDVQLLQAIAAYTSVALGRGELFTSVWRDAHLDPLTEMSNRRALEQRFLDADWGACDPVLLLGDLDGFKDVNDREGHPAGDALLRTVADTFRRCVDDSDHVLSARLGGDEFCVFLEQGGLAVAEEIARCVNREIAAATDAQISMTWGAAEAGLTIRNGQDLLAAADAALIRAKSQGRGRFTTDLNLPPVPANRRRRSSTDADSLCSRVATLINSHRPLPVLTALEIVATETCALIEGSGWAVSFRDLTDSVLQIHRGADHIHDLSSGLCVVRADYVTGPHELATFPVTARLMATGSAGVQSLDLDESDAAEQAFLRFLGHRAVALAGASDLSRSYLVEVYSATGHDELTSVLDSLQVLVHFCVGVAGSPT
ncbi:diguanylate cyclase (GGDEF)-like protein [Mycolicibacterium iranicum]|uniref:Diguanylate cyclase (GGDEF)-like protein n=1 Tax=Mycolicibacterium iranicum TaxID=912594 RepID=A0A839Q6K8_MYCIR|nr:diguanylate cyclase [Mycolicibacterium iranicum]MBB2991297.1 diguanylate cyclase (GGDEF)-like protein [Mycolicibacterium iranicum]